MWAYRGLTRKGVVVNTDSGQAFAGILWRQRGPLLVLRNVTFHEPGASPARLDGEVVIERTSVEFIQVTG